jgi:DNA-binding GntR family transcriptional regulator
MGESDRASRSVQDHMEIIEALESRDPDLAAKKVLEHTMRLHSHVDKTWTLIENVNGIDNDNNKFNLSKKITG